MSYELQLIDTNCNDCKHMVRDFEKFEYWKQWNLKIQQNEYEKTDKKKPFQFDKSTLLSYGNCTKLNKEVSFIPVTCTPQNKDCFTHRKN